jgi:transposase
VGKQLATYRLKVSAEWGQLKVGREWVLRTLAAYGIAVREEDLRYTVESTGRYHMPLCLAWKGKPSIINPSDTAKTRRKTDVLDADKLALQSLTGLWRQSWVAPARVQELRVLTIQRSKLVAERTRLTNRINGDLLRFGHTIGQVGPVAGKLVRPLIEDFCRNGRMVWPIWCAPSPGWRRKPLPTPDPRNIPAKATAQIDRGLMQRLRTPDLRGF